MGRSSHYDACHQLTPREREVRELLRLGLTDAEIAERLGISKSAVGHHVSAIISKLGVSNRHEAAYWPERPPWWTNGVAALGLVWERTSAALSGKAATAAMAASGATFAVALGGLGVMVALLLRAGGDVSSSNHALQAEAADIAPAEAAQDIAPALDPRQQPLASATPPPGGEEPARLPPASAVLPAQPAPADPIPPPGSATNASASEADRPPPQQDASSGPEPSTPTPVPGSVSTPTPLPRPGVMAIDCDAVTPGVQDDCRYEPGVPFRIQVHVTEAPEDGYYAFKARLQWNEHVGTYYPAADPADEGLWPGCDPMRHVVRLSILLYGCVPELGALVSSKETGPVLEFEFRCKSPGTTTVLLVVMEDIQEGTSFIDPRLRASEPQTVGAQLTCEP